MYALEVLADNESDEECLGEEELEELKEVPQISLNVMHGLQGVKFWFDVMLLPLGGCETVLGIQWLSTLGDIKCNFKDLRMEFVYKGKKMVLRGTPKSNLEWITNSKQAKMLKQNSQPEYSSMQLCVFPGPEISLMRLEGIPTEVKPELQSMIQEFKVFSV
ncbi:hypothetical protein Tco_1553361 [Tanacetum coccineum]